MDSIFVRQANLEDWVQIVDIIEESYPSTKRFDNVFVAENKNGNGKLIGCALCASTYSTWEGKSMYLKYLFVSRAAENKRDVMEGLLKQVANAAVEQGCKRLDFECKTCDTDTLKSIEETGAKNVTTNNEKWNLFSMSSVNIEEQTKPDLLKQDSAQVRIVQDGDWKSIADLIREMAKEMKSSVEPKIDARQLLEDYSKGYFRCFVAEKDQTIVGYIVYMYTFSVWKGKRLHVEEIFVRKNYRKDGTGTALMHEVAKDCSREKCAGMNWVCSENDVLLMKLYKARGGKNLTETKKMNLFRLNEKELEKYNKPTRILYNRLNPDPPH